jgi:hypothetical protein
LIGFHYQRSEPAAAAEDFLRCLHGIDLALNGQTALVSVILDGENCWEHYPGGGVAFLRALYERCVRTPSIQTTSIGGFLQDHPPQDTLPHLFAGSWISHNFAIWIGHEEDNAAWDALHRTREYLVRRGKEMGNGEWGMGKERPGPVPGGPRSPLERAWEELYIAEGSDWFWWYGDDHSSAQDALFDYLFRKHLQNVYLLLGDQPPPDLGRPISRRGQRVHCTMPRAFLDVKIDGRYTFFEWVSAGRYSCQNERGTMAMAAAGPLRELYFGFSLALLLIRLDCDRAARAALADVDAVRIGFVEPRGYEVCVRTPGRPQQAVSLLKDGKPLPAPGLAAAVDQIVEVAIPFDRLGVAVDQHLQFFVELQQGGLGRDRAPRDGTIVLTRPSPDFEQIMWDV